METIKRKSENYGWVIDAYKPMGIKNEEGRAGFVKFTTIKMRKAVATSAKVVWRDACSESYAMFQDFHRQIRQAPLSRATEKAITDFHNESMKMADEFFGRAMAQYQTA